MCESGVLAPRIPIYLTRLQTICDLILFDKFSGQASQMPPDGAFLHASKSSSRNPSWLTQQYNLPYFAAQSSAYSLDSGHAYPTDMPAPRMVTHTVDPSTLLHSQIPMHMLRAESFSESEAEVDNEGESDCNWDHQFDNDDAAGWRYHPGTIGIGIPDFDDTKIKGDMRDAAGLQVSVVMHARWVLKKRAAKQRGFWILYRRNYFGIQGSYQLKSLEDSSPDETLYLHRKNSKPEAIKTLFMCMRGVVDTEEGPEIKIVVFDAKRKPLHAGNEPPPIKPQRMKPLTEGSTKFYTESTGDRQDHMNVPMNHTFHRNQFRAATQNNGQRRTEQQYYHIVLELKAEIMVDGVPTLFTVASRISEPLVVRGRCPLSFKDKDKDKDGHTRDRGRKGRKQPRAGGGSGNKGGSTKQSQEEGQTKGQRKRASRSSSNKTGGCSRRSTRAASFNLPSLTYGTYGTRSRNTDTAPGSPQPNFGANGTVNRETIPRLDHKLLSLSGESWEGDWQWKRGDGPASEQHSKRFSKL